MDVNFLVKMLLNMNPKFNSIYKQLMSSPNPEQYVRKYATDHNIDIDQVIKTVQQSDIK